MLTRFKVSGFKNLWNVDVRFGPFTCVAGVNGVGKSNLFDAIRFMSFLSYKTIMEAALFVRDETGKTADIKSLFSRSGNHTATKMSFEAEMIIPDIGVDDLGQEAKATTTFVRYSIELGYRQEVDNWTSGGLELLKEELVHITQKQASKHLLFRHSPKWRKSIVTGKRPGPEFISTEGTTSDIRIKLHQDGKGGKPSTRKASDMPRTVLSATTAAEGPTATLVKKEMQSWQLLQLEPSALRSPDEFSASARLGSNGLHLPATLFRMINQKANGKTGLGKEQILALVGNRLAELVDDVRGIDVDRDERRELLTLNVQGRDRTIHPARALSDGTLRFLALAVLVNDPQFQGLLCLEEPENGIHPERISVMLRLLQDIATDPEEPVGADNPLRQVIINTHSPVVVQQVPDDSLLIAEWKEMKDGELIVRGISLSCLPKTWRVEKKSIDSIPFPTCGRGQLLAYLNPVLREEIDEEVRDKQKHRKQRVVDREDIKQLLLFPDK